MLTSSFIDIKRISLSWSLYWILAVAFLSLVLKPLGFDYNQNFIVFSLLYLMFGLIGLHLFNLRTFIFERVKRLNFLLLFVIPTFFFGTATLYFEKFYPLLPEQVEKIQEIGILFPLFNIETFIAKLSDIIFQQIMIFILVLGLERQGHSHKNIITSFTITFLVLHLPLIVIFKTYGFVFIIPAAFAGTLFSYIILKFKQGPCISIIVHQGFYLILGVLMRFWV